MTTYPIVEIFHSVQGEGYHSGMPHVFVRFGNCNLRCEWCDTDFLTYDEMDLQDIVEKVLSYNCKRVIFTGGEPCMQDLDKIGSVLKQHGISLSVETNGTIEVPDINANRNDYKILSWEIRAGDAIAFDFRTLHGASENVNKLSRRRIFSARIVGDDAFFVDRGGKGSPPFENIKLKTGDKLVGEEFPIIHQ